MIHQTNFNVMQLAHGGLLRHSVTELCREDLIMLWMCYQSLKSICVIFLAMWL